MENRKKRNGFSLPEILVACAIIVSLSVAAFFGYNQAQQTRKMAQMNNDMEALANGCLAYEALNMKSLPPASLEELSTGLTAEQSVRFLYKGIIIKHNKTEPTYTKTSLFLCEKRRFFMARTEKGVVATI